MNRKLERSNAIVIAALSLVLSTGAVAAEAPATESWVVLPSITTAATYTDNIRLESTSEDAELALELIPGLSISRATNRGELLFDYRAEGLYFHDEDNSEINHQLASSALYQLVPERLTVSGGLRRFQIVNASEGFANSNLSRGRSRTDSTTADVDFDYRQNFGGMRFSAGIGTFRAWYGGSGRGGVDAWSHQARVGLAGEVGRRFTWGADASARRNDYDGVDRDFVSNDFILNGAWQVNQAFTLTARSGLESDIDDPFASELSHLVWDVGFRATPIRRLALDFGVGQRSYGRSTRGLIEYEFRRGTVSMEYGEEPAGRNEALRDRNPIQQPGVVDGVLDRPGNADSFIRKRLDLRADYGANRLQVGVNLYVEDRENRIDQLGNPAPDERSKAVGLRMQYQLGRRARLNFNTDLTQREFDLFDDDFLTVSGSLIYDVSRQGSLDFTYRFSNQDGDTSLRDYDENQVRLAYTHTFL